MTERSSDIALITGGGSGIGRASALRLAQQGAHVAVADIDKKAAARTAEQIVREGGTAFSVEVDISDPLSIDRAFAEVSQRAGTVDVLVNSAGIIVVEPLLDFPLSEWSRVMAINVTGSFLCAQRAARDMAAKQYGRIINMASVSGFRAGVGRVAYGTSKAAIAGLTRQLALELGPLGITANAIAPGAIVTAMTEAAYTDETRAKLLPMIPAGHLGSPEDIAAAVVFLASREARYVNGEVLTVDGGYLAAGMTQTGNLRLGGS